MTQLDALLDELADRVAAKVAERLRDGPVDGWVDQHTSPLGARRHCALARRLVAQGDGSASKVGRRWLLRRERLDREMAGRSERADTSTTESTLAAELGLRLVAGKGAR